jgi:hypothetical protein
MLARLLRYARDLLLMLLLLLLVLFCCEQDAARAVVNYGTLSRQDLSDPFQNSGFRCVFRFGPHPGLSERTPAGTEGGREALCESPRMGAWCLPARDP